MNKEEAIKYLQQLYPNGGHCWLDEQRIEAIGMAIKALQEEPVSPCVECASISEGCKEICYDYNKWVRDNHKEEPVSEDLEEAIKRAADETKLTKAKNGHPFFSEEDFNLGFSNGAQWQLNKTLKWIESCCDSDLLSRTFLSDFKQAMNKTE